MSDSGPQNGTIYLIKNKANRCWIMNKALTLDQTPGMRLGATATRGHSTSRVAFVLAIFQPKADASLAE